MNDLQEYLRKTAAAKSELQSKGIFGKAAETFSFLFLRHLGLKPRNPLYFSFWQSSIWYGVPFGVFWGIWMYFIRGFRDIDSAMTSILIASTFFGLSMSLVNQWRIRKHKLSKWEDLYTPSVSL